MKKEEIYVVIDSEEKRQKAVQILTDAGEEISPLKGEMNIDFMNYVLRYTETLKHWFIGRSIEARTEITLDQLEQLLKPSLTFPREMMVRNDLHHDYKKRMVDGIFNGKYLSIMGDNNYFAFSYASEIDPPKPTFIQEVEQMAKERGNRIVSIQVVDDVLPEKWAVKRTEENYETINKWTNKNHTFYNFNDSIGYVLKQQYNHQLPYYQLPSGFTEITFEQFQKYVLKNEQ